MLLKNNAVRSFIGSGFAIFIGLTIGCPAHAQLEEVIVTAQKREESLQDVPINVTVMAGEFLDEFGIENFTDLEVPGVHYGEAGMGFQVYVRGIGSQPNNGFENSVPYYVDGVYFGRARAAFLGFLDTGSVEFLKGPQPTHLGKNAIGGATILNTRRPTSEFEAGIDVAYEFEHEESSAWGFVSGPLTETLSARFAVKARSLGGWMTNNAIPDSSQKEPEIDDVMARLGVLWEPNDAVEVFVKFEHMAAEQEGRNTQLYGCDVSVPGFVDPTLDDCVLNDTKAQIYDASFFPEDHMQIPPTPNNVMLPLDRPEFTRAYFTDFEFNGGLVRVDWDTGTTGIEFSSLTSYYDFTYQFFEKPDFVTLQKVTVQIPEAYNQFSQEFRLFSPTNDSGWSWTAGLYFDTDEIDSGRTAQLQLAGGNPLPSPPFPPGASGFVFDDIFTQEADTTAVFGEVVKDLSDTWALRVGGRFTSVEKTAYHQLFDAFERIIFLNGGEYTTADVIEPMERTTEISDDNFQPSVVVEWRPSEDVFLYGSYRGGFKAGAVVSDFDRTDFATNTGIELGPEEVDAYELGAKLMLADGAADLNATLFLTDYTDLQLQQLDFSTGVPRTFAANAGEAETFGIEVDGRWAVTDKLTLSGTLVWVDATFTEFRDAPCYPTQTPAEGCVNGVQDASGKKLPFSTEWSGSVTGDFRLPMGSLEFFTLLHVYFQDEFQGQVNYDPFTVQESYTKVDARLGIGSQEGRWQLALVGKNLTDELTASWRESPPLGTAPTGERLFFAISDRPRQIALQFSYRM